MLPLPLFHPSQFVKIRNLPSNLHGDVRRIEPRNPPHPAPAIQNTLRESRIPHTVGTHYAHPGNHHSSFHVPTSLSLIQGYMKKKKRYLDFLRVPSCPQPVLSAVEGWFKSLLSRRAL